MKNEFEEGVDVRHLGDGATGTVDNTNYPSPNFLVSWDDLDNSTLESFHTVELVDQDE